MSNKLFLGLCIVIVFCTSFKSVEVNEFDTNPTYLHFKTPELEVKLLREGLLCSGFHKDKYHIDFIKGISTKKFVAIQDFINRNKIWEMNSMYQNGNVILDGNWSVFILNKERKDEYKRILYSNCYNQVLDSLTIYLNDLIPANKKKYYDIDRYRLKPEQGNCTSK